MENKLSEIANRHCLLELDYTHEVASLPGSSYAQVKLYPKWKEKSYIVVLKRIVIFAIRIVASLTIEYQIIGAHTLTHRRMHPCMHARKHTRMHTNTQSSCSRWHTQLAANLFANNLEVFPRTGLLKGIDLLQLAILQSRRVKHHVRTNYVITWIFVYVL